MQRLFGDALSALPPPPQHFTLFFRFESDELTDESRALVPEILQAVRDTAGSRCRRRRAHGYDGDARRQLRARPEARQMVRNLLVEAGLDASAIEVTSHGEADLLVQTADETPEPRNRRVEITVR